MFPPDKNGILVLVLASMVVLSIVVFYFSHKIVSKGRNFWKRTSTPSVENLPSVPGNIVVQSFQSAFPISLLGKLSGCTISQEKIAGPCKRSREPSSERSIVLEPLSRECSQEEKYEFGDNLIRVRSPLLFDEQSSTMVDSFSVFFLDVFTTIAVQGAFSGAASGATLYIPFPMQPLAPGRVSDAYVAAFVEGFALAAASYAGPAGLVDALNLREIKFCCGDNNLFQMLAHAFNNSTTIQCIEDVKR
ncbi:conserved hypothetical protein [Neorickettsia risticii str. Illinois]|uniref:Uncharacterized protein n=1 Tax=Neorickettsia risticii (strain Illinois) TaxID=434131 RepID=C6V3Z9_NEORI|nr:hypothetical protein [Neorickettsia risticii]ACT69116.1 conserved hypothetical protein [Neorickettsia risticii str. Illinois]